MPKLYSMHLVITSIQMPRRCRFERVNTPLDYGPSFPSHHCLSHYPRERLRHRKDFWQFAGHASSSHSQYETWCQSTCFAISDIWKHMCFHISKHVLSDRVSHVLSQVCDIWYLKAHVLKCESGAVASPVGWARGPSDYFYLTVIFTNSSQWMSKLGKRICIWKPYWNRFYTLVSASGCIHKSELIFQCSRFEIIVWNGW